MKSDVPVKEESRYLYMLLLWWPILSLSTSGRKRLYCLEETKCGAVLNNCKYKKATQALHTFRVEQLTVVVTAE